MDVIEDAGLLFLGSRLKRLAERLQADVVGIAERAGLAIQPSQYPILVAIDRHGPQTIGALVHALRLSQPAVTRLVGRLHDLGLIAVERAHRDQRHKTVRLTDAGMEAIARSKLRVFPQVAAAVAEVTADLGGPLLDQLGRIEARLAERSLAARATTMATCGLSIREYADDLAEAFHDINVQWLSAMYRLEPTDFDVLLHPRERIVDQGGAILFVEADGLGIVGTCALQRTGERQFELNKMGVLEAARGCKAGEFLLAATIARAKAMGADLLYLLSNRKSAAAIHLYEKLGFVHDAEIMARFGARYARCDVAMRYRPA